MTSTVSIAEAISKPNEVITSTLKGRIVAMSPTVEYQKESEQVTWAKAIIHDGDTTVTVLCYVPDLIPRMRNGLNRGWTLKLSKFKITAEGDALVINKFTQATIQAKVMPLTNEQQAAGNDALYASEASISSLKEKTLKEKKRTRCSISGKVQKIAIRTEKFTKLIIKKDGEEVPITLWTPHNVTPVKAGQHLKLRDARTSDFRGNFGIDTMQGTVVDVTDSFVAIEVMHGTIIGQGNSDNGLVAVDFVPDNSEDSEEITYELSPGVHMPPTVELPFTCFIEVKEGVVHKITVEFEATD